MRYTEWITELKSNLLGVTEAEKRRVLDYYAEAYADRRAAGFSESEIIDGFGAPYDAARAILEDDGVDESGPKEPESETVIEEKGEKGGEYFEKPPKKEEKEAAAKAEPTYLLAIPLFFLFIPICGITVGLVASPFAVAAAGVSFFVGGVGAMIGGAAAAGVIYAGIGIAICGAAVLAECFTFWLVKIIWKYIGGAIKKLFAPAGGKR